MKKYVLLVLLASSFFPLAALGVDTMEPRVNILNSNLQQTGSFLAFDGKFDNGMDVAVGDLDGDKKAEIIVGAERGGGPMVQVFNADGKRLGQFMAYDGSLRCGINVAVGDLDRDGKAEIVTGTGYGCGPQIRIFDGSGKPKLTMGFSAFVDGFRGGVDVTVGDFNGDKKKDIVAAAGPNSEPHVRVFDRQGNFISTEFRPFASDNRGGVSLATANVDGGKDDEYVMAINGAGEAWVKVYKDNGQVLGEWKTFPNFYGGVEVSAGDIDNDGKDEIAVTPRQSAGAQILFYEGYGKLVKSTFVYASDFRGGVRVAGGDVNGDKKDEFITTPGRNHAQGRLDLIRYIDTDLSEQKTYVYEYGELLREFYISSGIARYPTPQGNFSVLQKVYVKRYKHEYPDRPQDNYDLPNVHWNLRFSGGYFLHYAYWHHNFGHPMSHGCINIDRENAEWLYNWARVGDPVIVHQ